ncbi:MAG TPA: CvpA family protein [Candidatus Limnocylindrales bacterium]|nr:CvpA family protein [Candidatus Limnocylindrales bacterium]
MFNFASLLSQLSIPPLGINILDIIIVLVVLFYLHEGFSLGFTLAFLDLASFVLSFIIALKFYGLISYFLLNTFSLPVGFANAGGFFITALICEIVLSILFRKLINRFPSIPPHNKLFVFFKDTDHWLGLLPGLASAFIVLSFILSVIVSLPSSPLIKSLVTDSRMSSKLISNTSFFEKRLNDIFGGALSETLNFLTVQPQSDELVKLNFKVSSGKKDSKAEQEMFRMVNTQRAKAGVQLLAFDNSLRDVARRHSDDMLKRGFFSHYTPEGLSPFDRMEKADIEFTFAGENLALAPSTDLAMQGLMNSPGHRKNILSPNFRKIGVGVIDGGIYGKMYSQEFTD